MTTPLFTPSSNDLLNMIAQAERKCDHSIEQARLQREAQAKASLPGWLLMAVLNLPR
jgi:hypothetical protein